jgi:hypothetical protein
MWGKQEFYALVAARLQLGLDQELSLRICVFGESIHVYPRTCRPVQQSLQVEARELVIWASADLRRKRGDRTGIAGFQLGKGREVILR